MKFKNIKVGQIVKLKKNAGEYSNIDEFVKTGTLGEVVCINERANEDIFVKWQIQSIPDQRWCSHKEIKLIRDVE